ncbi:DUF2383 domain-containing protein [Salinimicrobium sp. GXAS 041]|uniref:DUF2383 domain-containing protein n=1 Tax=Salinimicrobium sp. GXAS 041 TaxID=3400806 RepID=UPI003C78AD7B
MSNRLKCAGRLNELLESNFLIAKCFRKIKKSTKKEDLQRFFQKKASKRYQFAIELSEEIGYLKEAYCSYGPFSASKKKLWVVPEQDFTRHLKTIIRNDKKILKEYRNAMAEINEAPTREIIIRHAAIIEKDLFELRALKKKIQLQQKSEPDLQTL